MHEAIVIFRMIKDRNLAKNWQSLLFITDEVFSKTLSDKNRTKKAIRLSK